MTCVACHSEGETDCAGLFGGFSSYRVKAIAFFLLCFSLILDFLRSSFMSRIILCSLLLSPNLYAASYTVDSESALESALLVAGPGDSILLEAGSYMGNRTLSASGTAGDPVVIKSLEPGTAYFKGTFTVFGTGLVLDGIQFRDAGQLIIGSNNETVDANAIRVTNCTFRRLTTDHWLRVNEGAHNVTIDHNAFTDKQTEKQMIQIRPSASGYMNHVIRRNYFADIAPGGGNGYETLQIGPSPEFIHRVTNVLVERNLFEWADGEAEIISVKTSGNKILYNTFRRSKGSLVFRQGHNNVAVGNVFLGEGVSRTGGIRFQGDNNVIINNYLEGIMGTDGRAPLSVMDGVPDSFYNAVNTATVMYNSFINSSALQFGTLTGTADTETPPEDLRFMNNVLYRSSGSDPFIELADTGGDGLSDDQLINPVISGNIYFGGVPGLDDQSGFQYVDPQLVRLVAGLYGPGQYSPLIDASVASSPVVVFDALGRERSGTADTGAIEGITGDPPYPPLTRNDVGPTAPGHLAWLVTVNTLLLF